MAGGVGAGLSYTRAIGYFAAMIAVRLSACRFARAAAAGLPPKSETCAQERRRVKNAKLAALPALLAALLAAAPAAAQTVPPPPPVPAVPPAAPVTPAPPPPAVLPPGDAVLSPKPPAGPPSLPPPGAGEVRVRIVTAAGTIVVDLDRAHAPLTTANFLKYADQKRFDGTTFYRADTVRAADHLGLIQGGVHGNVKLMLPPVAHEPTTKTGLAHGEGTISMARAAPGSARGDFFITTGPLSSLDAHPQETGDNVGYAAFGHVVDGMDVVRQILGGPVSDAGEGAMRGQLLVKPVKIVEVRRGGRP